MVGRPLLRPVAGTPDPARAGVCTAAIAGRAHRIRGIGALGRDRTPLAASPLPGDTNPNALDGERCRLSPYCGGAPSHKTTAPV